MASQETWSRFPDLDYADGKASAETIYPVVERNGAAILYDPPSLALHIHAYYLDGLEDILDRVCLNKILPDIVVTGPENQKAAAQNILASYPLSTEYVACANVGRDIAPFLSILPQLFERKYDLIGHVHVKKSIDRNPSEFVASWSDHLFSSLIGNFAENITAIDDLARNFKLSGGNVSLYLPHFSDNLGWGDVRDLSRELYQEICTIPLPDRFIFSVGTMFWSKPDYLAKFAKLNIDWQKAVPDPWSMIIRYYTH